MAVLLLTWAPLAAAELTVTHARFRALLPGQSRTAAYFDITNSGAQPVVLVGAASDAAGAIEFHRIIHDGDMVRMRRLEKVVVGPAETVRFEPGGYHLMLFRVGALGEHARIKLLTASGEPIEVVFRRVPVGGE